MSNTNPTSCPRCGATLPADAPEGLCPRCLAAAALQTVELTGGATSALPPPPVEEIAPHFPQLEILSCLGRGGMGVVYKARQKSLDRIVALKLLAPEREKDPAFAARFEREARALAKLNHPNIVTVYDFGQAGGFFYLLMEYVDGANLRTLLRAHKFTPAQALAIVPTLCDALQYAHDRGIVHRDIKPENLLMDKEGRVKVADFGLAKMLDAAPGDEPPAGTPSYMAPEQASDPARVDNRADIYSLGVVFYEMLTGELPGSRLETSSRVVRIDVRLDEIVLRALETDPELRYQQASIFKTQVENVVAAAGGGLPQEVSAAARPGGAKPPAPDTTVADAARIETAKRMVVIPSIGLRIAGLASLGWFCLTFFFIVIYFGQQRVGSGTHSFDVFGVTVPFLLMTLELAVGFLVIFGASRMARLRSYGLAITASILAMLMPPGLILGIPFGIWSLVVLSRPDVRDMFGEAPPKPRWPRRKLIRTGARLLFIAFLLVFGSYAISMAWPRSYRSQARVIIKAPAELREGAKASVVKIAQMPDLGGDVQIAFLPRTEIVQISASNPNAKTAADEANAFVTGIFAQLKKDFPDNPEVELMKLQDASPASAPYSPNVAAIMVLALFIALPWLALPGAVMLLMGLFRHE